MPRSISLRFAPALAALCLVACGGGADGGAQSKVEEQFRKQFGAQCSLEYLNRGLAPEQKSAVCGCATDELLAKLDLPSGEEFTRVKVTMDDIGPALQKCEKKVGINVMTGKQAQP